MSVKILYDALDFWRRQKRNWKIVVTRQIFNRFFDRLTLGYTNIYIRQLGASPLQLGSVNSISGIASTLIATPIGWLQDRYSLKRIITIGIGLFTVIPLIYALAFDWIMVVPAVLITGLCLRIASCATICDLSLESKDRATGKALCEVIGSTPSLLAPSVGAILITIFGGISAEAIRPLFWIQFCARCLLFLFIATQLGEITRIKKTRSRKSYIGDFREIFDHGTAIKRWIIFYFITTFTLGMITPFLEPFANEIKGAGQLIIGGMTTAQVLTQVLFAAPLGRLADRIGRKKMFYLLTPLYAVSNLLLVLAPTDEFLVISAILMGFRTITTVISIGAMIPELVPSEYIGRWRGLIGLFYGLANFTSPIIGGYVWENLSPNYVFLIPPVIDFFICIPLMYSIPETLKKNL